MKTWLIIILILADGHSFARQQVKSISVKEVCSVGNPDGSSFIQVGDVAVDSKGNIYVTDRYQYKVKKFDRQGRYLSEFGGRGKGVGKFQAGPFKIDCASDTIAVVDVGTPNVLFSTIDFKMLGEFTAHGPIVDIAFDGKGRLYAAAIPGGDNDEVIKLYDKKGEVVAHIPLRPMRNDLAYQMTMLAVDPRNRLVVAFSYNNRVIIYSEAHQVLTEFKVQGLPDEAAAENFNGEQKGAIPEGEIFRDVACDGKGWIYLLGGFYSRHPNRDVYVFNEQGELVASFVLPDESGMLSIDRQGYLYTRERQRTVVKKYILIYIYH